MVHLEGPEGEELFSRESGHLNDHERRALAHFRCPWCGTPLDLIELESRMPAEGDCELVARCRTCTITFTQEDWHASHHAA